MTTRRLETIGMRTLLCAAVLSAAAVIFNLF